MRSTILTGLSLLLFMLLLVLAAAFMFLFQGRQTLQQRADSFSTQATKLGQDLAEAQSDLNSLEATREATAAELATAESEVFLLEGQLVESQQQKEELADQAEALAADLADVNDNLNQLLQERDETLLRPPQVEIVAPQDGAVVEPGESVQVVAVAADATGVTAVSLTVDGQPLESESVDSRPLITIRDTWTAAGSGPHTISAVAASENGMTSEPVTVTIQVIDLAALNLATLTEVEENVSDLRGQTLQQPVTIDFIDREAWQQQAGAAIKAAISPEDIPRHVLTLAALDFVPADYDLATAAAALQDQFGPSVHEPDRAGFVVVTEEGELTLAAQVVHVHDYVHVLQDQQHQLDQLAAEVSDADARDAFHALIEGEAELVQSLYLAAGYFPEGQIAPPAASGDVQLLPTIPPVLSEEWLFPQKTGLAFAQELYLQGGNSFTLIDAAWRDLPRSSEQILHPDRYLQGDAPEIVTLPTLTETLGAGWELVESDVLGEFYLRHYLRQQLSEEQSDLAAAGWGGDRYAIYWREEDGALVMVLRLAWDTVADRAEFAGVYPNYPTHLFEASGQVQPSGGECWQGADVICFYGFGNDTVIVRAPDLDLATAVAAELENGG